MGVVRTSGFVPGLIAGVGLVFLYHHFVSPVPGAKKAGG